MACVCSSGASQEVCTHFAVFCFYSLVVQLFSYSVDVNPEYAPFAVQTILQDSSSKAAMVYALPHYIRCTQEVSWCVWF